MYMIDKGFSFWVSTKNLNKQDNKHLLFIALHLT